MAKQNLQDNADHESAFQIPPELDDDVPTNPAALPAFNPHLDVATTSQQQHNSFMKNLFARVGSPIEELTPEQRALRMAEDDANLAEYHRETVVGQARISTLTQLMEKINTLVCSQCGSQMFGSALDTQQVFQQWLDSESEMFSLVTCYHCQTTSSCLGCVTSTCSKISYVVRQGKKVSWCCASGRIFLIWILLCGFDQQYCSSTSKVISASPRSPEQPSFAYRGEKPAGQDYQNTIILGPSRPSIPTMPKGTGFAGHSDYCDSPYQIFNPHSVLLGQLETFAKIKQKIHAAEKARWGETRTLDHKAAAQEKQNAQDAVGTLVLGFLQDLMPSNERDTEFDKQPPEVIIELLSGSKILTYCAELLRNDSLEDATKRMRVYSVLIGFLRGVAGHAATNAAFSRERAIWPDRVNLQTLSFNRVGEMLTETARPLTECARNLFVQGEMILKNAQRNETAFETPAGRDLLLLCRKLSELNLFIHDCGVMSSDTQTKSFSVEAIIEVPDEQILHSHAYASKAEALPSSQPGRMKRLITEITNLATGLPQGVFVRYCENRPDVMKCCIVGPQGTPYENGLFEFDLYCGLEFPNKPPMMTFKGTDGGRVTINPNLYPNGTVCLSLLGTWPGEPWNPKQSTILQLLVSIQAMIFCDQPWYSEPGRSTLYPSQPQNDPSAVKYNHEIRECTVQVGMLPWLNDTPNLWKDVVHQHFAQNGNKILQTVSEWSRAQILYSQKTDNRCNLYYPGVSEFLARTTTIGPTQKDLKTVLPQLQTALKPYGATFHVPELLESAMQQKTLSFDQKQSASPISAELDAYLSFLTPKSPSSPGVFGFSEQPTSAYLPPYSQQSLPYHPGLMPLNQPSHGLMAGYTTSPTTASNPANASAGEIPGPFSTPTTTTHHGNPTSSLWSTGFGTSPWGIGSSNIGYNNPSAPFTSQPTHQTGQAHAYFHHSPIAPTTASWSNEMNHYTTGGRAGNIHGGGHDQAQGHGKDQDHGKDQGRGHGSAHDGRA